MRRVRETLGATALTRRLRTLEMEAPERAAAVGELERLREAVGELLRAPKGR